MTYRNITACLARLHRAGSPVAPRTAHNLQFRHYIETNTTACFKQHSEHAVEQSVLSVVFV